MTGTACLLKLDAITIDPDVQDRERLNTLAVAEYAASDLAAFPPVRVWDDGVVKRLSSGHHTLEAHRANGKTKVRALVFRGDKAAAILDAVASNTRHGLRRSGLDRRRAAAQVLKVKPQWSDRQVAAHAQVDEALVASVRRNLEGAQVRNEGTCATKRSAKNNRMQPASAAEAELQRSLILRLAAADPSRSSRDIASEVGCSPRTVDAARKATGPGRKVSAVLCARCERSGRVFDCQGCETLRRDRLRNRKPKPKPEPKVRADDLLTDIRGNTVPAPLRDAFADPWILESIDFIAVTSESFRQQFLADGMHKRKKSYPFYDATEFADGVGFVVDYLDKLLKHLVDHRPVCVCPACSGAKCAVCRESGLVSKTLLKELEAAL